MSELFPDRRGSAGVADDLGRVYTPTWLARAVARELGTVGLFLEPSVGGGQIVRAVRERHPDARVVGVDIDPAADGRLLCSRFVLGDWAVVARNLRHQFTNDQLVICGNPPFGRAVGIATTIAHVRGALELDPRLCRLILPAAYICGSEFDAVFRLRRPARVLRVTKRPWPDRLREVAVFEWLRDHAGPTVLDDLDRWEAE